MKTKIEAKYADHWLKEMPGLDKITLDDNVYLHAVSDMILLKKTGSNNAFMFWDDNKNKYGKYKNTVLLWLTILRCFPVDIKKIILSMIKVNYEKYFVAFSKYGRAKLFVHEINVGWFYNSYENYSTKTKKVNAYIDGKKIMYETNIEKKQKYKSKIMDLIYRLEPRSYLYKNTLFGIMGNINNYSIEELKIKKSMLHFAFGGGLFISY